MGSPTRSALAMRWQSLGDLLVAYYTRRSRLRQGVTGLPNPGQQPEADLSALVDEDANLPDTVPEARVGSVR